MIKITEAKITTSKLRVNIRNGLQALMISVVVQHRDGSNLSGAIFFLHIG